jgi:hypothetical protein
VIASTVGTGASEVSIQFAAVGGVGSRGRNQSTPSPARIVFVLAQTRRFLLMVPLDQLVQVVDQRVARRSRRPFGQRDKVELVENLQATAPRALGTLPVKSGMEGHFARLREYDEILVERAAPQLDIGRRHRRAFRQRTLKIIATGEKEDPAPPT